MDKNPPPSPEKKKQYEENITFKEIINGKEKVQAQGHLTYVLESLVRSYGKAAVVDAIKNL